MEETKNTITFNLATSEELASAFSAKVVGDKFHVELDCVVGTIVQGDKAVCALKKVVLDQDDPIENTGENSSSITVTGPDDDDQE